jgi:hypothetical protein
MQVLPIVIDNMPAPPEIAELVERFDQYNAKYKSNSYNETQVRREFIDPFSSTSQSLAVKKRLYIAVSMQRMLRLTGLCMSYMS